MRGILIGLSIAAPVGPIGILCIRRTLTSGRLHGFVSGLGAASADAIYGSVAAFGLTAISNWLVGLQTWLRLFGGLFLVYMAVRIFLSKPLPISLQPDRRDLLSAYLTTFALTLTNPMTIVFFIALIANLGSSGSNGQPLKPAILVAGVFAGSAMWWLALSLMTGFLTGRRGENAMRWVNRLSGAALLTFGLLILTGLV